MEIQEFIESVNNHTKEIFKNEIIEVNENGQIINWLLGLAGGALLFSLNRYSSAEPDNSLLIKIQIAFFALIIIVGFFHRIFTKSFRSFTVSMIRMFDFLAIEFKLEPDEIQSDIEDGHFDSICERYLEGEYFIDEDDKTFTDLRKKYVRRRN